MQDRVSQSFVDKNVTGENDTVVYGESTNEETGSANMVTSVVVNYRSFDTLRRSYGAVHLSIRCWAAAKRQEKAPDVCTCTELYTKARSTCGVSG